MKGIPRTDIGRERGGVKEDKETIQTPGWDEGRGKD